MATSSLTPTPSPAPVTTTAATQTFAASPASVVQTIADEVVTELEALVKPVSEEVAAQVATLAKAGLVKIQEAAGVLYDKAVAEVKADSQQALADAQAKIVELESTLLGKIEKDANTAEVAAVSAWDSVKSHFASIEQHLQAKTALHFQVPGWVTYLETELAAVKAKLVG